MRTSSWSSEHDSGIRPARAQPQLPADLTREPWWDDHTRPALTRASPPLAVPRPLPGGPASSRPGRHARPRRLRVSSGLGRIGAAQLAVVAAVVALGLAVTCWWLVHSSAHSAPELSAAPAAGLVAPTPALQPIADGSATSPAATPRPATVTVDVAGKVRHPGIVVLDAGARVVDALKAAGGARPGIDLTGLNLARALVDGEQVLVGEPAAAGVAAAAPVQSAASPSGPTALVDLNTATAAELDSLPDVGPVTAASILAWRDQHGGFSSVDELLEVDGIGEATLGKLAPYVTV